jgi:hypothetical protein
MKPVPDKTPQASLFHRQNQPVADPVIIGLAKLEAVEALHLPMYVRVLSMEFQTRLASPSQLATLRMEIQPVRAPHLRAQLWFENVKNVQVPCLPEDGILCSKLQIEDARVEGRPGVNWKIHNADAENLLLFAEKVEVVAVYVGG